MIDKYQSNINLYSTEISTATQPSDAQKKWDLIAKTLKSAAKISTDRPDNMRRQMYDPEIEVLSNRQKSLREDINAIKKGKDSQLTQEKEEKSFRQNEIGQCDN